MGDKFAEIVSLDGEMVLLIAGPVRDGEGNLAGVVVVGRWLAGLVSELKQETFYHISLYRLDGQLVESTLFNQASLDTDVAKAVIENQDEAGYLRNYQLLDHRYREIVSVFELRGKDDFGLLGVTSPTSYLENTSRQTRLQVFVYMTILLFLTLVTGIYIARLITNPIQSLKSAALQVSAGDLDVNVEPIGEDEIAILTQSFNQMIANLKASKTELLDAYDKSLEGWAKALELRDRETEGHTRRVTNLTVALAQSLGISGEKLENIRRGALLHDIGKVGVPDQILHKPSQLTAEEFSVIKNHPQYAYDMLSEISFLKGAIDIPYCHHEKWDGRGYPQGLEQTDIPLAARIFAVVDVWDAVTSDRIYRASMSREAAIQILNDGSGSHFDPMVVDAFLERVLPSQDHEA
jgi:putative nucleotidyltransferase with HDIG domain